MEPLLREVFDVLALEHATVANEGDVCDAKPGLDFRKLRRKGLWIMRIAWKDFDGDRLPILVAQQADDNLALPLFAIAIVTKGRQGVVRPFQVATGHIIQKQGDWFGLGALHQEPILYRSLGLSQPSQVLIERIFIKRV